MSRWFRHYAGMMRDDKLVRAALRSKQPIERVVWVWGCILESASEIDDGGRYEIDHAEMAYFLRADESDLVAVEDALGALGRVTEGVVANWKDRQFQSDRSAERQKRYRERHKGAGDGDEAALRDAGVTSPSRHGDAPEAETDTELEQTAQQERATRPKATDLSELLFEAAGIAGFRDERHPRLQDLSPIYGLIDAGYDLRREILPIIAAKAQNKTFSSWRFFENAIIEAATANRSIPTKPQPPDVDWVSRVEAWRKDPTIWIHAWGPPPGERGCRVPSELLVAAA